MTKQAKYYLVFLVLIAAILLSSPVFAATVTDAKYLGTIRATNNGALANGVSVNVSNLNSAQLIAQGFAQSDMSDVVLQRNGVEIPFMPGNGSNPWVFYISSISATSTADYNLYTGNVSGGKFRYFPGATGMSIADSASMEPSSNFTTELSCYCDTTQIGEPLFLKKGAISSRVASAGTVNATIFANTGSDIRYVAASSQYCDKAAAVVSPSGGTVTYEAWVYLSSLTAGYQCILNTGTATGSLCVRLQVDSSGRVYWEVDKTGGGAIAGSYLSTSALATGEWHLITATYDKNATPYTTVYVDGEEWAGADGGVGGDIYQPNTFLQVGATYAGGVPTSYFNGYIDEARISSSARTLAEHQAAYNYAPPFVVDGTTVSLWHFNEGAGDPADATGTNNLVRQNAPAWSTNSPVGQSLSVSAPVASGEHVIEVYGCANYPQWATGDVLEFDGTDDVINCGSGATLDALTGTITIDAWVKPDSAGENTLGNIAGFGGFNIWLRMEGTTACGFRIYVGTVGKSAVSPTGSVSYGSWHHVVGVFNGTNVLIYVDNVLTTGDATAGPIDAHAADSFLIGDNAGSNRGFDGPIGPVRVYSVAANAATVANRYAGDYSDRTGLVGEWYLDEGTGTSIPDYSGNSNTGTLTNGTWTTATYTGTDKTGTLCDFTLSSSATSRYGENLKGASVPNNSNDFVVGDDEATPYIEYFKHTVGGILVCDIDWEYGATFHDATAYNNDATPSFRTTSSDTDVSAELISFVPTEPAQLTTYSIAEVPEVFSSNASAPSQLYTEGDFTHLPGAEAVNEIIDASGTPRALWWYPLLFISVAIVAFLVYQATYNKGQATGSLLTTAIVCDALLALLGIMNPIMLWPAILFWIPAGALILSQKHYGWG